MPPISSSAHVCFACEESPQTCVNWRGDARTFPRVVRSSPRPASCDQTRKARWVVSYAWQEQPARVRRRVDDGDEARIILRRLALALRTGTRMKPAIAANTSSLNCRWIVPGSAHCVADWSYAICVRDFSERLVNESDCAHCPRWEEPDDAARRLATLAWNRMSSPSKVEP